MNLPKLEWIHGRADVSKWFGEGTEYALRDIGGAEYDRPWVVDKAPQDVPCCVERTKADAKQAARQHFHKRLQKPMIFAEAMAAGVRGCHVVCEIHNGGTYVFVEDGMFWRMINGEKSAFHLQEDEEGCKWFFYFPEKVYAKINKRIELWICPKCGREAIPTYGLETFECTCGVILHRPA